MRNPVDSDEQRFVTNFSSLKTIIDGMDSLLNDPKNQDCKVYDIINKFLTHNKVVNERIRSGELKEIDLDSLEMGEKFVLQLIPASVLRHNSRSLMSEIKKSISANGKDLDDVVLLLSIMLLCAEHGN